MMRKTFGQRKTKRKIDSYFTDLRPPVPSIDHAVTDLTTDAATIEPPKKKRQWLTRLPSLPVPASAPPEPRPQVSVRICNCKQVPPSGNDDLVECSDTSCETTIYHRFCVGLSNRERYPDTSKWRCRDCRTARPASDQVPSPSSQQMSSISGAPQPTNIAVPSVDQEPALHPQQLQVVDSIMEGYNTFYTGSAGTGKSTVAKAFNKGLRSHGKHVEVVAPSGIAALAIGGCTIWAYAGWHPNIFKEGLKKLLEKAHNKSVRKRLCKTDVLVIDEISMVESDMFTRLDKVMREAREGYRPEYGQRRPKSKHSGRLAFGGAQIVVTGDFCQLPPVLPFQYCLQCGGDELEGYNKQDGSPKTCKRCRREYLDAEKWAFRSPAWRAAKFQCFELRQIHRQSDDKFISILQKCRMGELLTQPEQDLLLRKKTNMETAVKLLPQKAEVNRRNQQGLSTLQGLSRTYECRDFFDFRSVNEPELQYKGKPLYENKPNGPIAALKDHRFEACVELKVNMLVILLVNLDLQSGLVNGSQGKIIGFEPYNPNTTLVPRPPTSPSRTGKSSDRADVVSEMASIKEDQIRQFIESAPRKEWPIVLFNNGTTKTIYGHCQINEIGSERPHSLLGRSQIPLVAAWAITIHKSQGMTLDRVSVDLYNSFEKEMVYVALSRARTLEGLEVVRLPKVWKSGMNAEVAEFLKESGL